MIVAFVFALGIAFYYGCAAEEPRVIERVDVENVWTGHPVGFRLLTHRDHQFVAYYNAKREMTVASRKLGETKWTIQRLSSITGWDPHNYVTMALDGDEYLHVSGNMHNDTLVYFRSEKPLDVTSIKPVHRMTGKAEDRVTYPNFLYDTKGRLLFMYRNGTSGDGERLVNIYDEEKRSWKRLIETPLLNGRERSMNAYPSGPIKGPDGRFHLVWTWRNTGDAQTNHDISYARSSDFVHWETAGGKPVSLPITPDNKNVTVDPIPPNNGLINMGHKVSFDKAGRPVVIYHKYDSQGHSQVFLARWEKNAWKIRPASSWTTRWKFGGHGSLPLEVSGGPLVTLPDGRLVQSWYNKKHGSGTWQLDPETLRNIGSVELPPRFPKHLQAPTSDFTTEYRGWYSGMMVRWGGDIGDKDPSGATKYYLRWETLQNVTQSPIQGTLPEPSMLRVYRFQVK